MKPPKKFFHEEVWAVQVRCKGRDYCGQEFGVDLADMSQIDEVECFECGASVEVLSSTKVVRLHENPEYTIWWDFEKLRRGIQK